MQQLTVLAGDVHQCGIQVRGFRTHDYAARKFSMGDRSGKQFFQMHMHFKSTINISQGIVLFLSYASARGDGDPNVPTG